MFLKDYYNEDGKTEKIETDENDILNLIKIELLFQIIL